MATAILVNPSGNPDIDGILWGYKWDHTNLTFGFPTSLAPYVGYGPVTGFQSMDTAGYVPLILRTLHLYDSVCGLSFTFQNDAAVANIRYALADTVNMNDGRGAVPTGSAFSTPPDPTKFPDYAWGDGWFSHNLIANPQIGDFYVAAWMTHEPGHGLGLKHGMVTQDDHGVTFPALPSDHDSQEYSVMTYRRYVGDPQPSPPGADLFHSEYPSTLMQDDILALQYMYGADYGTNNGDTTYTWSTTTGEMFINGVGQGVALHNKVFLTVWDGGGNDTYDMSNYTNGVTIDLRPGQWSITSPGQLADLAAEAPGQHMARGNVANAQIDPNLPNETASLIENAIGGPGNDTITGNDVANQLFGGAGQDTINGLGGDDFIQGGPGIDVMDGGPGTDTVDYSYSSENWTLNLAAGTATPASGGTETILNFENVVGGSGNDTITGTDAPNVLNGGSGNDVISGGFGLDTLDGGPGTDTADYTYSSENWTINLTAGTAVPASGGTETILNFENVTVGGGNDNLVGNTAANQLVGGSGNDSLDGKTGSDQMIGGPGDDTYFVDNVGDAVVENANEGNDVVHAAIDYTIGANIESLILDGTTINGAGNGTDNAITGNASNNIIDGKAGSDFMQGGGGNDIYFVDNAGDAIVENANAGNDIVHAAIDYTIGANIESLILDGTTINGAGNAVDNAITGNGGNNIIDGKAGSDFMVGGAGNDIYFVDNAGDAIVENANEGNDIVHATIDYTIGANIESLILDGTTINGAGNSTDNAITGNSADNIIDGKAGSDFMQGGTGNDIYFVDNAGDAIVENTNAGNDIVHASISYTIGANIESLILDGSANLAGAGNSTNNALVGNSGNNNLDGHGGQDFLTGNAGNDTFEFQSGEAAGDVVADFAGNGAAAGDNFLFIGYGTTGATFTQIGATNQWQIHSGLDAHNEVITLQNSATVNAGDYVFV